MLTYIVEDDPVAAYLAELMIRKEQFCSEVQSYVNGQRAFDSLKEANETGGALPDVILLDLNMPLMDGWDFLDAFDSLAIAKDVCVFVVTSSIRPDDIEKTTHYKHVRGFFSKPIDEKALKRMQHLLEVPNN
ncbi:response regulator [Hymenobacter arizonensis]|uniref:CheY chemotaxis protein or a CheY-like REC (Receiver) domain n=1 Tax=Hymenobacter arizonensis TaxID=1227077 RepID=A0A1I5SY96_HYMAR|nr:response regulator [Hymenobacter arizonensis]SFP75186.1 CheY chemotaxis protein or a CheY-like REC (receiver) domain [Hymenobacter arizonensis]